MDDELTAWKEGETEMTLSISISLPDDHNGTLLIHEHGLGYAIQVNHTDLDEPLPDMLTGYISSALQMANGDLLPFQQCSRKEECVNPLGSILPATTDFFYRNKSKRNGLMSGCKKCHNTWAENNRERVREIHKAYRDRDPEYHAKMRAIAKRYYQNHPELCRERSRQWCHANPDKARQRSRNYYWKDPAARSAEYKAWLHRAPGRQASRYHKRRALEAQAEGTFTPQEWQACLEYFGRRCAVCGAEANLWTLITVDHWVPLSKGGRNDITNIVPLCHVKRSVPGIHTSCNSSKHSRDATEWLIEKFGEKKAHQILKRIDAYFAHVRENGLQS